MGGNSKIVSTGYNPEQGTYDVLDIYMLGNGAVKLDGSTQKRGRSSTRPKAKSSIGGNATWIGMIAGKTMNIHGNPTIESDPNITAPDYHLREPAAAHPLRRVHRRHRARRPTPTAEPTGHDSGR